VPEFVSQPHKKFSDCMVFVKSVNLFCKQENFRKVKILSTFILYYFSGKLQLLRRFLACIQTILLAFLIYQFHFSVQLF